MDKMSDKGQHSFFLFIFGKEKYLEYTGRDKLSGKWSKVEGKTIINKKDFSYISGLDTVL